MRSVALVGLVDARGWLLLQERDDLAPVDPDKWSLVGGGVEPGESPLQAAHRELGEETGIVGHALDDLGWHTLPCAVHGSDDVHLFAGVTSLTDADIVCGEGRQIVFVAPDQIARLDLTDMSRALVGLVITHVGR